MALQGLTLYISPVLNQVLYRYIVDFIGEPYYNLRCELCHSTVQKSIETYSFYLCYNTHFLLLSMLPFFAIQKGK